MRTDDDDNDDDDEYSPPESMRKKSTNRTRFEQIKSLESIFESESRFEPTKKLQLGAQLGLHPRQVSIWFQNKRDYSVLLANYNTLASRFQALNRY
ncbi:Homeobox-leucine zipper protein ATHB-7, partial [Cucurbita argyrosperma subsp. sororia]